MKTALKSPLRLAALSSGMAAMLILQGCNMQPKEPTGMENAPEPPMMERQETGVMVGGAMMVPSLNIVENAMKANNVTTLVAAVKAAGLVETLSGPGPFTVFAPTDAAFGKLPAGTVENLVMPENKTMLTDILTYHVVAGSYKAAALEDGMTLTTVQGDQITLTENNGQWWVNGTAMIQTADVISSNGVTHVIDTVLMPE